MVIAKRKAFLDYTERRQKLGLKPQAVEEHHKVIFGCPVDKSNDWSSFYILQLHQQTHHTKHVIHLSLDHG